MLYLENIQSCTGREEDYIELVKREKRKFFCKFLNRLTPNDLKVAGKWQGKLQRLFLKGEEEFQHSQSFLTLSIDHRSSWDS